MKKKKSVLRRVLNWICTIAILGIIALLAFVVINNLKGNVSFVGNKAVVWVKTGSMEPTIPAQSYIQVEKVDPKDLKEGDVITFVSSELGGSLNTHRIRKIEPNGDHILFYTKGDNSPQDRYPISEQSVVGRYCRNLPTLSKIGRFLSTPVGMVTMILAVLLLTAAAFAPDVIAIVKERDKKKKQAEMDKMVQAEVERMKRDAEVLKPEEKPESKEDPAKPEEPEKAEPQKSETEKIEEE